MKIVRLKQLIYQLQQENKPGDKYLLDFYKAMYQDQLQQIADKVQKQLDQDQEDKKAWSEYLSK